MIPLRRPSRRILEKNDLTGGVPTQLGLLTKLTCEPPHLAPPPASKPWQSRGWDGTESGGA